MPADGRLKNPSDESFLITNHPVVPGNPVALNLHRNVDRVGRGRKLMRSRADIIRRFLESKRPQDLDEKGRTRFIAMIENMVRLASGKSPQAVAAFNAVMGYAYGKPKPSEEEMDALSRQGGIQLVYIARADIDGDIPFVKETKQLKAPEFIDAEEVKDERQG